MAGATCGLVPQKLPDYAAEETAEGASENVGNRLVG